MPRFKCYECEIEFIGKTRNDRIKRYCSKNCSNVGKIKKMPISICATCSKEYVLTQRNHKGKFCSHTCIRYLGPSDKLGLFKGFWSLLNEEQKLIKIRDQFEKTVIRQNGCWSWKKSPLTTGYASLYTGKRKLMSGHRISWILHYGTIPKGLFVLHKCDNRICTNPEHLFLGTHIDNMRDMVSKNRHGKQKGKNVVRA